MQQHTRSESTLKGKNSSVFILAAKNAMSSSAPEAGLHLMPLNSIEQYQ